MLNIQIALKSLGESLKKCSNEAIRRVSVTEVKATPRPTKQEENNTIMKIIRIAQQDFKKNRYIDWKNTCATPEIVSEQFYLNNVLHLEDFVYSLELIFPSFCIIKDFVFLYMNGENLTPTENEIEDALERKSGIALENYLHSYNQINLAEYFNASVADTDDKVFLKCLSLMEFGWKSSLKQLFPNMKFKILTSMNDDCDPIISFSQVIS